MNSQEVRARAAAARLFANACGESSALWNQQEALHAVARSQPEAAAAALPLVTICRGCPIVEECRQWAVVDRYTGIAAAAAWVNGKRKEFHWVHRHPPKKLAG